MSQSKPGRALGLLVALSGCIVAGEAGAQINLAGQWAGSYHEDQEDRLPGPELGDYGGLPINDADRMRARAWSAAILSPVRWFMHSWTM